MRTRWPWRPRDRFLPSGGPARRRAADPSSAETRRQTRRRQTRRGCVPARRLARCPSSATTRPARVSIVRSCRLNQRCPLQPRGVRVRQPGHERMAVSVRKAGSSRSRLARKLGLDWQSPRAIPGYCEPWPVNRKASRARTCAAPACTPSLGIPPEGTQSRTQLLRCASPDPPKALDLVDPARVRREGDVADIVGRGSGQHASNRLASSERAGRLRAFRVRRCIGRPVSGRSGSGSGAGVFLENDVSVRSRRIQTS